MPDTFVGDFSQVKDRNFNTKHLPEGEYRAKVTKIEDHQSKSGKVNWLYTISITDKRGRGAAYPMYCGLETDQLWKIRNLYSACGVTIPKKKVRLRRDALLSKELGVVLEDDEYEGKMKSVIATCIPLSELHDDTDEADDDDVEEDVEEEEDEDEEEEEEPTPPPKKKKKAAAAEPAPPAKKKKAKAPADDELEEIEIEDL